MDGTGNQMTNLATDESRKEFEARAEEWLTRERNWNPSCFLDDEDFIFGNSARELMADFAMQEAQAATQKELDRWMLACAGVFKAFVLISGDPEKALRTYVQATAQAATRKAMERCASIVEKSEWFGRHKVAAAIRAGAGKEK